MLPPLHILTARLLTALTVLAALPAQRDQRYLEMAFRQLKEYERETPRLDPERLGAGALEAAALADSAEPYVTAGLAQCTGQWGRVECERMLLAFQRVVLQYSSALPAPLLARLRTEAAASVTPRPDEAEHDPWDFHDTENQRAVRLARCLAAYSVEPGAPGSARAAESAVWAAATVAFLRARDRAGWYEAESPGYIATSATALLHLADHAPQPAVRLLARRELDLLFADWAQRQVNGFPAGAKSRSYLHWALGARNTQWAAWAWLAGGIGDERQIWLMDWPEIATSRYVVPEAIVELLAARRRQSYEILARRSLTQAGRRPLDTALYTYATPDYVLGAAQSVDGLSLGLSGGQEIMATLYATGPEFAPLYLWSRARNLPAERWTSWAGQDFAVGSRNLLVARLADGRGIGHAYLSPPWSRPEKVSEDVLVSRCGETYVALVTAGGWEVEPATRRFPGYYGDPAFRDAWVAVPRVQPASVALEAGRRAEVGDFSRWAKQAAAARLAMTDGGEIQFSAAGGTRISFLPGERAAIDGRRLDARSYPLLSGPFFKSTGVGAWSFSFGRREMRFRPLE
ncbi:MAG TPA: hypothetical protein VH988_00890 [Thermoanaerobaculia bacterium]|jgi:hypothetical protein|nr:hypothetical protein [Thermoanaerobaculia bacterium]